MRKRNLFIPMLLMISTSMAMAFTGCAKVDNNTEVEATEEIMEYQSEYQGFHTFCEKIGGPFVYQEAAEKRILPEYILVEGEDINEYLQSEYLPQMADIMLRNINSFQINVDIIVELKELLKSEDISWLSEEMISDILSECYQNIQVMGINFN